jgi:hypothetical protein
LLGLHPLIPGGIQVRTISSTIPYHTSHTIPYTANLVALHKVVDEAHARLKLFRRDALAARAVAREDACAQPTGLVRTTPTAGYKLKPYHTIPYHTIKKPMPAIPSHTMHQYHAIPAPRPKLVSLHTAMPSPSSDTRITLEERGVRSGVRRFSQEV